jgi:hypothetical protein
MARKLATELQRLFDMLTKNITVLRSLDLPLDSLSRNSKGIQDHSKTQCLGKTCKNYFKSAAMPWTHWSSTNHQRVNASQTGTEKSAHNRSQTLHVNTNVSIMCPLCHGRHHLRYYCKFRQMSVKDHLGTTAKFRICTNCFHQTTTPADWVVANATANGNKR